LLFRRHFELVDTSGFTKFIIPPALTITELTANTWASGNIPTTDDVQWFKFTATAATTHYIHIKAGTMNNLNIRVYNASGTTNGYEEGIMPGSENQYFSRNLTADQVYYLKVYPGSPSSYYINTGTYQIAFNTNTTPPSP